MSDPSDSFVPTPYPMLELAWPFSWAVVGLFLFVAFPFVASIYLLITVPIGLFFSARFAIDLIGAWADHRWGRERWVRDRLASRPCGTHVFSGEDPSCPFRHINQ